MSEMETVITPANGIIFREGDPGDWAALLIKGRVRVFMTRKGADIELSTLHPVTFFGELAVINQLPRSATAQALEDCTLVLVSQESLQARIAGLDPFMQDWIRHVSQRFADLNQHVSPSIQHNSAPPLRQAPVFGKKA